MELSDQTYTSSYKDQLGSVKMSQKWLNPANYTMTYDCDGVQNVMQEKSSFYCENACKERRKRADDIAFLVFSGLVCTKINWVGLA